MPWAAFTLGVLSIFIIILKFRRLPKVRLLLVVLSLAIASYGFALPWSFSYHPPVHGLGIVEDKSPLLPWLSFWGSTVLLISIAIIKVVQLRWRNNVLSVSFKQIPGFFVAVIGAVVFFLAFMELIYMKDIFSGGEFFRAVTVLKISEQLWLWMGVLSGPIIIWVLFSIQKPKVRLALALTLSLMLLGQAIYPVKAVWQARLENKTTSSFTYGIQWWQKQFPSDYQAYLYLSQVKNRLPRHEKIKNIIEGEGDSYTGASRFSTFLGWPTIIGSSIHEWNWRGNYDVVASRVEEVREIYTGKNERETKQILQKYDIDFIIIGELEQQKYQGNINLRKLLDMGEVAFTNGTTTVIKTR